MAHASATGFRTTSLPSGELVPVLGQGTWGMAEHPERRAAEIAALRLGLDLGMTLIDTTCRATLLGSPFGEAESLALRV